MYLDRIVATKVKEVEALSQQFSLAAAALHCRTACYQRLPQRSD